MSRRNYAAPGAFTPRRQRFQRDGKCRWTGIHPGLVRAICSAIPAGSAVVDLGAAAGLMVLALRELGYAADGVDGTRGIERITRGVVRWADLTSGCPELMGRYDWAVCLDVGEHVPPELAGRFLDTAAAVPKAGLVLSWAGPRLAWYPGHVNCLPLDRVLGEFARRGLAFDEARTAAARAIWPGLKRRMLSVLVRPGV